jgi:hypothetical protein
MESAEKKNSQAAQAAKKNNHPENQTKDQKDLPEAAKIEVLETLGAEPRPSTLNPALNSCVFASQASENDDDQSAEQSEGKPVLTARLPSGNHGREENAGGQKRGGNPENRKLNMPGARDVKGQDAREFETKKVRNVSAVVLRSASEQRLQGKQEGHDQEEPAARSLRRGQRHLVRRTERNLLVLPAVPAQEIPAAKRREQKADASQQSDQGENTPNNGIGGSVVRDERFRRPIVRIGVKEIRAQGRSGPSRPTEERGQLPNLFRIGDGKGAQSVLAAAGSQEVRIVSIELLKCFRLCRAIGQSSRDAVVAIRFEIGNRPLLGCLRRWAAIVVNGDEGCAMKIVRREIGPEIGAMSEDRAVFHQPAAEKDLLAGCYIASGKENLAARINHLRRNRGLVGVGPIGEDAENQKAAQEYDHNGLNPALGDE